MNIANHLLLKNFHSSRSFLRQTVRMCIKSIITFFSTLGHVNEKASEKFLNKWLIYLSIEARLTPKGDYLFNNSEQTNFSKVKSFKIITKLFFVTSRFFFSPSLAFFSIFDDVFGNVLVHCLFTSASWCIGHLKWAIIPQNLWFECVIWRWVFHIDNTKF